MAKMILEDIKKLDEVAAGAALQATSTKSAETKDILVRDVPVQIYKILKQNKLSFASYARVAVKEKMQREGLL